MSDDLPPITDDIPENELEAEAEHTVLVNEDGEDDNDADA